MPTATPFGQVQKHLHKEGAAHHQLQPVHKLWLKVDHNHTQELLTETILFLKSQSLQWDLARESELLEFGRVMKNSLVKLLGSQVGLKVPELNQRSFAL